MLVLHFWTDVRIIPCCQLGVFEMSQLGLAVVSNPSEIFLTEQHSDSDFLAGLAVAVIMDGSRSFLIEIQVIFIITFYTSYFLKISCMQWIHHYLRMRSPMMILLRFPFFLVLFIYLFSPNADGPLKLLFRLFVSLVHQFQGTLMESNQAELTWSYL